MYSTGICIANVDCLIIWYHPIFDFLIFDIIWSHLSFDYLIHNDIWYHLIHDKMWYLIASDICYHAIFDIIWSHLISVILSHLQTTPQGTGSVSLLKEQRLKLNVELIFMRLFVHEIFWFVDYILSSKRNFKCLWILTKTNWLIAQCW